VAGGPGGVRRDRRLGRYPGPPGPCG